MKRKRDNPTPPPVVQPVSYGGGGSAWDDNNNDDNDNDVVFNGGLSAAATWGSSSDRASSVSTGFGDSSSANNFDNNNDGAGGGDAKSSIIRYRAVYQFDSRNPDELNLQIGDVVLVDENHESDPGWLTGRLDGRSGLFPEAYVEKILTSMTEPPVQSQPVSALSADAAAAWGTKAVTPGEKPASPGVMPVGSISTKAPPGMTAKVLFPFQAC